MDVLSMRQRVANAIKAGEDSHMAFGQFDYSFYGRRPPYVVRDFRKEHQVVFESHDQDAVSKKYDELVMIYRVDLILAELETPTDGMLNAALVAKYPDWGSGKYADSDDARVIDGMRSALSASAKAAREGK